MFQIIDTSTDPARLTQSILQARDLLGIYNAELARILGVTCADVGRLGVARHYLVPETRAWQQALLLRSTYQLLYERLEGNSVAMNHWLRKAHPDMMPTPLLLMVDHEGLPVVHDYLLKQSIVNAKSMIF